MKLSIPIKKKINPYMKLKANYPVKYCFAISLGKQWNYSAANYNLITAKRITIQLQRSELSNPKVKNLN